MFMSKLNDDDDNDVIGDVGDFKFH